MSGLADKAGTLAYKTSALPIKLFEEGTYQHFLFRHFLQKHRVSNRQTNNLKN